MLTKVRARLLCQRMDISAPPITTPFDATSTATEVLAGIDLTGRRGVITGGASGIGLETARALAAAGAQITLAVRDEGAGHAAAQDIRNSATDAVIEVTALDLADLSSVEAFVAAWSGPLHILVNNAGVMQTPFRRTTQGWESQFGINHLGHFALTIGLYPALVAAGSARIVVLSSSGHGASSVVFDDLFFERRPYDPSSAYGQSKTANALFAVEATCRWAEDGITANAVMPGGIWTKLQRNWDPADLARMKAEVPAVGPDGAGVKTPQQGAATSVLVATSPLLDGVGGRYFEDCHEAAVVDRISNGLHGVRGYALDPSAASRLWDVSVRLIEDAGFGALAARGG